jgi:hypothetical protein
MTVPVASGRSTFKTSPQMGLPSRWCVGDLSPQFTTPIIALNAVNSNTTSTAINCYANSVELWVAFADPDTFCDIIVTNLVGGQFIGGAWTGGSYVQVAQFLGVNLFKANGLFVGQLDQGITLQGAPIQITAQNFRTNQGILPGNVTVSVSRIN